MQIFILESGRETCLRRLLGDLPEIILVFLQSVAKPCSKSALLKLKLMLWTIVWQSLEKLDTEVQNNPAVPPVRIYLSKRVERRS